MSPSIPPPLLTSQAWADLRRAKALLENPGLTARLANLVGSPIEKGFQMLPEGWTNTVHRATHKALLTALSVAVRSMDDRPGTAATNTAHKIMVGATGAFGGMLGLVTLPVELPLSTILMLRSIAGIARSEGHRIDSLEVRLACLEVFALGGRSRRDDAAENAYWVVRSALAKSLRDATAYLAQRRVIEESAPVVVRLISAIASRFGVVISEQIAAKAVPVLGAVTGSTINVLFLDHFQNMARGHFIVKRLEAHYGTDLIARAYDLCDRA